MAIYLPIKERIKFHIDEAKAYQAEIDRRGNVPAVYDHKDFIKWHKKQAKILLEEAKQCSSKKKK